MEELIKLKEFKKKKKKKEEEENGAHKGFYFCFHFYYLMNIVCKIRGRFKFFMFSFISSFSNRSYCS